MVSRKSFHTHSGLKKAEDGGEFLYLKDLKKNRSLKCNLKQGK